MALCGWLNHQLGSAIAKTVLFSLFDRSALAVVLVMSISFNQRCARLIVHGSYSGFYNPKKYSDNFAFQQQFVSS